MLLLILFADTRARAFSLSTARECVSHFEKWKCDSFSRKVSPVLWIQLLVMQTSSFFYPVHFWGFFPFQFFIVPKYRAITKIY